MYPYLAALTGAREIRVPLAEGDVHDLEAMAAEVTAATQLLVVCNPNNPTATHIPAAEIAAFCERIPPHVTIVLDEAYVEFQTHDDPDATLDLLADFPNLVVLRTFSKCYGLAGLRVGYAIGSAKFRAAIDAVRQPFSVNALAQAAGAEAILHSDDVVRRVESTIDRAGPGRDGAARDRPRHSREPGQLLLARSRRRRGGGGRRRARRARDRRPPRDAAGRPRPPPRHLWHDRRERALPRCSRRDPGLKAVDSEPRTRATTCEADAVEAWTPRAAPAPPAPRSTPARLHAIPGDLARRPAWRHRAAHLLAALRPGADIRRGARANRCGRRADARPGK